MRGDLLRVLQLAPVLEVGGDASRAERVAPDLRRDARGASPPANHPPRVRLTHCLEGKRPPRGGGQGPEEGTAGLVADVGGGEVGVEVLLERVVDWYDVFLAALLVQAQLPALALGEVIGDLEREGGADGG